MKASDPKEASLEASKLLLDHWIHFFLESCFWNILRFSSLEASFESFYSSAILQTSILVIRRFALGLLRFRLGELGLLRFRLVELGLFRFGLGLLCI